MRTVHDCVLDIDNKILAAQMDKQTQYTTLTKTYLSLKWFPFAVQKTIALEEKEIEIQLEKNRLYLSGNTVIGYSSVISFDLNTINFHDNIYFT